ncbi:flagellar hook-basal body complex protein FliE [Sedimentibacter sp. B4]|uniref:flagellar hook-basal body complex protein FliE n=1 Tax=Sedimentibacter sp. B4 TaxID=304766 RepID=UPI0002EF9504|nr:flagellar hook-basal body complex protein FliE [Sedimentibacter sp. B4]
MFIEPIQPIKGIYQINELSKNENTVEKGNSLFKSIFDNALNDYISAEKQVDEDIYKLSTGESDDVHNLMINTKKAELSLDLMIQLRNKTLDAYNEIMRMNL